MAYAEPTITLRDGDKGEGVKWLQDKLNFYGFGLEVDGEFGALTKNAAKIFQAYAGLTADGIVGALTKATLKTIESLVNNVSTPADRVVAKALTELCTREAGGDDQYIAAYNEESGAGFGNTVSWCQIFIWWVYSFFGYDVPVTASCTAARKHYIDSGKWHEPKGYAPKKGDIVYFDWDKSGDCDHVGIVISVDEQFIKTVEGNTSTVINDGVAIKTHDRNSSIIAGYADPFMAVPGEEAEYSLVFTKLEDAEHFVKQFRDFGMKIVRA